MKHNPSTNRTQAEKRVIKTAMHWYNNPSGMFFPKCDCNACKNHEKFYEACAALKKARGK